MITLYFFLLKIVYFSHANVCIVLFINNKVRFGACVQIILYLCTQNK